MDQQQANPAQPAPRKNKGKKIAAGIIGGLILIGGCSAATSGGDDDSSTKPTDKTNASPQKTTDNTTPKAKPQPKTDDSKAVFKVWGTGNPDITYGDESSHLQGDLSGGTWSKSMPVKDDALFYSVTAQLQGSGDIHCSVTIGDDTKTGQAKGGYNICTVQINSGLGGF